MRLYVIKKKRMVMDLFPPKLKRIWNEWEIRVLVLISLSIQVFLIRFGSLRKHTNSKWITIPLWIAYLSADSIATLALGVLSSNSGESTPNLNNELVGFWAPFLLLHLGGPDTITALSIEDNELWLRHLLGLISHVSITLYVFIRSLGRVSPLLPATFLLLFAGTIKYSERTLALMRASRENLRDSLVPPPDAGPNYAKFMEEYYFKTNAGKDAKIVWDNESLSQTHPSLNHTDEQEPGQERIQNLSKAYELFGIFKRLIVDLILTFQDRNQSQSFFQRISCQNAFDIIELELLFVYEVLYTKAAVLYTLPGCIFRIFNILFVFTAFIIFLLLVEKDQYLTTDVIITYVLMGGALILELWSLGRLLFSNWTIIWLNRKKEKKESFISDLLLKANLHLRSETWSNSMSQYNVISFCIKDHPTHFTRFMKFIGYKDMYDKYYYKTEITVRDELKEFIFDDLNKKLKMTDGTAQSCNRFATSRGTLALQTLGISNYDKEIVRSIEVEFDESILRWHIATNICYYLDINEIDTYSKEVESIRTLSNYLMYLLVCRPFMLTDGIGQIRFLDTCAEGKKFFHFKNKEYDEGQACRKLYNVNTDIPPKQVKGDASKSALFDGSRLAKSLQKLEKETRWELMSLMWVEMLCYAASNCRGNYHAQRLSNGGELLTVVWFLMAHLGIGEQYRVEAGNARAKWSIKN